MTVIYFKFANKFANVTVITDSQIAKSLSKKDLYFLVKRLLKSEMQKYLLSRYLTTGYKI